MTDDQGIDRAQIAREIGSGRQFAENLREERIRRGWSQAELSRRMRALGYPIDQAAISKIEAPPDSDRVRRIDIDEAIGFATVFSMSLEDMTLPAVKDDELNAFTLMAQAGRFVSRVDRSQQKLDQAARFIAIASSMYPAVEDRRRESAATLDHKSDEYRFLERVSQYFEADGALAAKVGFDANNADDVRTFEVELRDWAATSTLLGMDEY